MNWKLRTKLLRGAVGALPLLLCLGARLAHAQAPQIVLGFDGSNMLNAEPTFPDPLAIVPDTVGAVGASHVVEFVNGRYAVYRKSDGVLLQASGTDAFWTGASAHDFYPGGVHEPLSYSNDHRVLYDPVSQRWFAAAIVANLLPGYPSVLGFTPNQLLLAVSTTSDPTQGWSGFAFSAGTDWEDFPHLGLNADGVYLSAARLSTGVSPSPIGLDVFVVPKADLIAPVPTTANATHLQRTTTSIYSVSAQPIVNLDGGGQPETLIAGRAGVFGVMELATLSGPITGPSYGSVRFIPVGAKPFPISAAQPGPKPDLDAGGSFNGEIMSSIVQQGGAIWAAQSVLGDNGHDAVRWFQIDAATDAVLHSGVITHSTLDLTFPSIAVNPLGEILIGMTGSSESEFASAYAVAGRIVSGVPSFGDPFLLKAGAAAVELEFTWDLTGTPSAWGQISATVLDPTDPHGFWTFQEYARGVDQWGTWIAKIQIAPAPSVPALPGAANLLLPALLGLGALAFRRGSQAARPGGRDLR